MADEGDADAQYVLGTAYQYGLGLEHSDEKSFEWYGRAVDQGHLPALYDMPGFSWSESGSANPLGKPSRC